MKKSQTIRLTLAAGVSAILLACGPSQPKQAVQCYKDPVTGACVTQYRTGYMPVYYPMFFNGTYYGSGGYVERAPLRGSPQYVAAQSRSVGTSFGANGAVSSKSGAAKGGFGASAKSSSAGSAAS